MSINDNSGDVIVSVNYSVVDVRPHLGIEIASRRHQNIAFIGKDFAVWTFDLDLPFACAWIPFGAHYLMRQFDEAISSILLGR